MKQIHTFKVKSGDKMVEFGIVEASKAVSREGEMVYAKTYANCVREGLLTNAEASKLATERNGILTEMEKEDYLKALNEYLSKDKEATELKAKNEDASLAELACKAAKDRVLFYQNKNDTVFEFTAESKARDAVLLHYALALTIKDGKPYFEGKDYVARTKSYDDKVDEIKDEVMKRAIWVSTALFFGITDLNSVKYPGDTDTITPAPEPKNA